MSRPVDCTGASRSSRPPVGPSQTLSSGSPVDHGPVREGAVGADACGVVVARRRRRRRTGPWRLARTAAPRGASAGRRRSIRRCADPRAMRPSYRAKSDPRLNGPENAVNRGAALGAPRSPPSSSRARAERHRCARRAAARECGRQRCSRRSAPACRRSARGSARPGEFDVAQDLRLAHVRVVDGLLRRVDRARGNVRGLELGERRGGGALCAPARHALGQERAVLAARGVAREARISSGAPAPRSGRHQRSKSGCTDHLREDPAVARCGTRRSARRSGCGSRSRRGRACARAARRAARSRP